MSLTPEQEAIQIAGRWNYSSLTEPIQYGDDASYRMAAEWLNCCEEVEDRGCGGAYARKFYTTKYVGVDGSPSKWTDRVEDLMVYVRSVPGITIRHVLEHNWEWRPILQNALDSFTKRMVLTLFIKPTEQDEDVYPAADHPELYKVVPNRGLCKADLMAMLEPYLVSVTEVPHTGEMMYFLEKK